MIKYLCGNSRCAIGEMIKNLYIKNLALIDELEINFDKGLNILTGETGSGKSIIIGAIDLVFGARASKDLIKTGADKAFIEITLNLEDTFPFEMLESNAIELSGEKELIVSREITPSATRLRINGIMVTQAYIQGLRSCLLDIHTQHESYNYINPAMHIELLDNYGQTGYGELINEYRQSFNSLKTVRKELETARAAAGENEQKIDFLKFQIKEIKTGQIEDINEHDKLLNERSVLLNSEELKKLTFSGYSALYGEDQSITDVLDKIEKKLAKASEFDEKLVEIKETIFSSSINLKEAAKELRDYSENLETNPQRLHDAEERIQVLDKLKKKYGPKLTDVLQNLEKFESELNKINFSDEKITNLIEQVKILEEKTFSLAEKLSNSRKKLAQNLSAKIQDELVRLEMPKVRFCVSVEPSKELTADGYDSVEFLISPNIGESLKPLAKIASGGEISRVMLAVKTIFARSDRVNTVIFDEIDTGISGKTSQAVAEAFVKLSSSHQILCITHQPIIAAMADRHIYIQKTQDHSTTTISLQILDKEAHLKAIAALASGSGDDEDSINFARKLLTQADNCKKEAIFKVSC